MISPRSREPVPRPFGMFFRPASRMALLGLCLPAVLCLGRSAVAAGSFSSAKNKREKPYAVIFGTVWGPDDHPLYGVRVKIRREDEKKARWELYSDHNGEFAQHVPAGKQDYVIWADLERRNFENGNQLHGEEVKVHVDADERVDTGLHLK
ncbi:MAG TPA: hypothetical protein VN948_10470 [Terriglobales bacterium]|nr:hypothetical protein [Terriglobales bacterium]